MRSTPTAGARAAPSEGPRGWPLTTRIRPPMSTARRSRGAPASVDAATRRGGGVEAADRLASIVQIVRAELGDPRVLISSSMDGETRNKRFAALYERLDGVGAVEIAFALVKYYWTYWDKAEADDLRGGDVRGRMGGLEIVIVVVVVVVGGGGGG